MWTIWASLFGKNESLGEGIDFTEENKKETEKPFDYDEFDWYNPFDWGGNYDKSIENYWARKRSEEKSKYNLYFIIVAGLFGIYLIRR